MDNEHKEKRKLIDWQERIESNINNIPKMIEFFGNSQFINQNFINHPDSIIFRDKNLWTNPEFIAFLLKDTGKYRRISKIKSPHFFQNKESISAILDYQRDAIKHFNRDFFKDVESLVYALSIYIKKEEAFINERMIVAPSSINLASLAGYMDIINKIKHNSPIYKEHLQSPFYVYKTDFFNEIRNFYEFASIKAMEKAMLNDILQHEETNVQNKPSSKPHQSRKF